MSPTPKAKRVAIPPKTKKRLQQEIGSECPFCDDSDVAHFDYHHIDGNRSNSVFENLLMCCKPCHSKITYHDISKEAVIAKKKSLPFAKIELASITIDSSNCSWLPFDDMPNAFYNGHNNKSHLPILTFSLINHYKKTILLTGISLKAKIIRTPPTCGLPEPQILYPSVKYQIPITYTESGTWHRLEGQLEVPAEKAFQFQVELYEEQNGKIVTIEQGALLNFSFYFGNQLEEIKTSSVFMNCRHEGEQLAIYYLG